MNQFTRRTFGGVLLTVAILGLAYLVFIERWRRSRREGFQTASPPTTLRDLNVDYPFKEVFLVSALPSVFGVPSELMSRNSNIAQTYDDAEAICKRYQGTLATLDQIQKAADLSGCWCAPGWVKDDRANTYYLQSDQKDCRVNTAAGLQKVPVPANSKAFPICYAVKPASGVISAEDLNAGRGGAQNFNRFSYNMVDPVAVLTVAEGAPDDPFPYKFKVSQALEAIDRLIVKVPGKRLDKAGLQEVRTALITDLKTKGLATTNDEVVKVAEPAYTDEVKELCPQLADVANDFKTKLATLQTIFRDISGTTLKAIEAKKENSSLQQQILEICRNESEETSPGCAKLATLDLDAFYEGDRNVLVTTEELNFLLTARETELQNVLTQLQRVAKQLECEPCTGTNADRCVYDPTVFGDNQALFDETKGDFVDKRRDPTTGKLLYPNAFNVGSKLEYNNGELLKIYLQELSPYIVERGYGKSLERVLNKLSYILRVPTLGDYFDAKRDWTEANELSIKIRGRMPSLAR